jgi:ketosteroid isomerase-like protein
MRRSVLLGSLTLGLVVQMQPASSQSADIDAIKAANAAYYSALSAGDISAMEQVWAKDDQVSNIFSQAKEPLFGLNAVIAGYDALFKRRQGAEVLDVMAEPSVRQEGDFAIVLGVEALQVKPVNGDVVKTIAVATHNFVRRDTRWFLIHHHTSRPPAQ